MVTGRVSCNLAMKQSMVNLRVMVSHNVRLSELNRKFWLKHPGDTLCMAQAKWHVT